LVIDADLRHRSASSSLGAKKAVGVVALKCLEDDVNGAQKDVSWVGEPRAD
jgi:hypothetical protein